MVFADEARTTRTAIERIKAGDNSLESIDLGQSDYTTDDLFEFANCLLKYPTVVRFLELDNNQFTDDVGYKFGDFIRINNTIQWLDLSDTEIYLDTYEAVAIGLYVNTSLSNLYLHQDECEDEPEDFSSTVATLFVVALRLNPCRPHKSRWVIRDYHDDFERLQRIAENSTPPSMLEFVLYVHLDTKKNKTKTH